RGPGGGGAAPRPPRGARGRSRVARHHPRGRRARARAPRRRSPPRVSGGRGRGVRRRPARAGALRRGRVMRADRPLGPSTAIVTDSAADLPVAERRPSWRVVPIPVNFGAEAFRGGGDLDPAPLYHRPRGTRGPPPP